MASRVVLLSLASLSTVTAETVLGVYIFHRHGDRTAKQPGNVNLTSLGAQECFESGSYYRSVYVSSNASSPIFGLSSDIADAEQLGITSAVDNVIQNSAQVFLQGLYPPAGTLSSQQLANGTSVENPLGGYQYIPVSAVTSSSTSTNAESSEWLQGGTDCNNAEISSNNYFVSEEYQDLFNGTKSFYQSLLPVINSTFNDTQATYKNAYTIYDLIHVATIHNKTIPSSDLLTNQTLFELSYLASDHEWGLAYNSSDTIRAIAGMTLAAQVVQALNETIAGKGKVPFNAQFGAYGTFMSFFGLAQLEKISADFTGIVDYASSMVFELVSNATVSKASYPTASDISVRFMVANGTAAEHTPQVYPLFGQNETILPWGTFVSEMNKFAIGDTQSWCNACGNSDGLCAAYVSPSGSGSGSTTSTSKSGNGVSKPVAGVIGALVTLVVILGIEALVYLLAGLRLVRKSRLASSGAAAATTTGAKA